MLQEATRLLDDNIVQDVREIDLGLVLGIGFPPFRGGLLYWADSVGLPTILQWLQPLAPLGSSDGTDTAFASDGATMRNSMPQGVTPCLSELPLTPEKHTRFRILGIRVTADAKLARSLRDLFLNTANLLINALKISKIRS